MIIELSNERSLTSPPIGIKENITINENYELPIVEINKKARGFKVYTKDRNENRFRYGSKEPNKELTIFMKPTFLEAFLWLMDFMLIELNTAILAGMSTVFLLLSAFVLAWPLVPIVLLSMLAIYSTIPFKRFKGGIK